LITVVTLDGTRWVPIPEGRVSEAKLSLRDGLRLWPRRAARGRLVTVPSPKCC
jgi:hypothetical protein